MLPIRHILGRDRTERFVEPERLQLWRLWLLRRIAMRIDDAIEGKSNLPLQLFHGVLSSAFLPALEWIHHHAIIP
ncbi:hypothetical protein LN519_07870 [Xanthomonas hortorum pv. gardneri]|nr:hypothetical protein [Xanthomonas hortorum pv. gardneri]